MRVARRDHACGIVEHPTRGPELVVAGGYNATNGSTEIFNLREQSWKMGPNLSYPIRNAEGVQFKDTLLVVNGFHWVKRNIVDHTIHKYIVEEERWDTILEHTQHGRSNGVSMMVSNKTTPCAQFDHIFAPKENM